MQRIKLSQLKNGPTTGELLQLCTMDPARTSMEGPTPKVHVDRFATMTVYDNRYNAPPTLMAVPDSESDLHAILYSVSQMLSEIVGCNRVILLLLNEDRQSARVYVLELGPDASHSPLVRDVPMGPGALTELINGRKPRYIAHPGELANVPELVAVVRFEASSGAPFHD